MLFVSLLCFSCCTSSSLDGEAFFSVEVMWGDLPIVNNAYENKEVLVVPRGYNPDDVISDFCDEKYRAVRGKPLCTSTIR